MLKKEQPNKANSNSSRVILYDWIRLFATIFVVLGHSCYLEIGTAFGGVSYTLPQNLGKIYFSSFNTFIQSLPRFLYGFHMPLFFALSGAVLGLKSGGVKDIDTFTKSKIRRLIFPYFLYAWFFMIPIKYLGGFYNKEGALLALGQGILNGIDNGHLWFLPALFWCMISFVLLQKILSKKTDSCYLLLLICGIIQMTYFYLPFDILGLKQGLSYLFWFALGYVFERERKNHPAWNLRTTLFAFLIVIGIEIVNWKYSILTSFFLTLVGIFFTYLLSDICSRCFVKVTETTLWKVLIRNLFYVYLLHDPLEYLVLKWSMKFQLLSTSFGYLVYYFSRTVLIFVLCVLLGECLSKISQKFQSFLKKESTRHKKMKAIHSN